MPTEPDFVNFSIDDSTEADVISNPRLDKFLALQIPECSRSKLQSLIKDGCVLVNESVATRGSYHLQKGDSIKVRLETTQNISEHIVPSDNVQFRTIYEDDSLLVIDKPCGLIVHPGAGNHQDTLVNGLVHQFGENKLSSGSNVLRPGIVHRIDKDTSGILVIAKTDNAHYDLSKQFEVHSIRRKYVCFCYGVPNICANTITTNIGRDSKNRIKMAVVQCGGKVAITKYRVMKIFMNSVAKIECELQTGRTHQIRVHMSHIGHSLIGDKLYKAKNYSVPSDIREYVNNFQRQALHAYFLEFAHPTTKEIMSFSSDIPQDMLEFEERLSGK